jgi:hypothetical protein
MVVPLVLMWVASIAAARRGGWFWKGTAAAQTAGYGVAALGLRVRLPGVAGRVLALGSYFVMVNAASATAVWNLLRGRRITRWEPARIDQDAA